ncbi:hypothetical protein [Antarcticirhabdus aurantiaca]|uniref:Uncharacterized protein n=1 Tax=Antarcticirhabdus aurantiaca TaxID=2606717 RepID=A0ACD4NJJ7_9HYPH|nr:hypothetical protein OXU80_18735 [Jeongeuplla avenae]
MQALRPSAIVQAPGSLANACSVLAHRVELSGAANADLDEDIADWLGEVPGFRSDDPVKARTAIWVSFCGRFVGDLTATDRLLDALFPKARYQFDSGQRGAKLPAAFVHVPGVLVPFAGIAPVRANALLAATLRAAADWLSSMPPPAANDAAPVLSIVTPEAAPCPLLPIAPSSTPIRPSAASSSDAEKSPASRLRRLVGRWA